jgi:hypothetical protein
MFKLSASKDALYIAAPEMQAQVPLADVRRILWLQKIVPIPTAEPDCCWVVETVDEALMIPADCPFAALLSGDLAAWLSTANCLYTASYDNAPLGWQTFKWNLAVGRGRVAKFPVSTLTSVLKYATVAGPVTLKDVIAKAGD